MNLFQNILVTLGCTLALSTMAQDRISINDLNRTSSGEPAAKNYLEKEKLNHIVDRFKDEHKSKEGMDGFRVQLFFGSRDEAQKLKGDFLNEYENEKAYLSYQAPNFKLRVGNFRSQLEAEKFLHRIRAKFPSAYVVNDRIEFPELEP